MQNIARMCDKMRRKEVIFRPHFKTHQSRVIGNWFRDFDIDKITVSSFRMASYFADDGWSDITVAFPVNLLEIDTINTLSGRINLQVVAEDPDVIGALDTQVSHSLGVFLKVDTGTHRTGLDPTDYDSVDACVEALQKSRHLKFKGFLSHAGHSYQTRKGDASMEQVYSQALHGVIDLKERYRSRHGDICISFGDTPGASIAEDFTGIDEMRPGNFVFYDLMQVQIGSCTADDIAVAMICPVVSVHPKRADIILYGGGIHFSKDALMSDEQVLTFGDVVRFDGASWDVTNRLGYLKALSQEHGVAHLKGDAITSLRPGSLVAVLPVHSCMTAQCMGAYRDEHGTRIDHFATSHYYTLQ